MLSDYILMDSNVILYTVGFIGSGAFILTVIGCALITFLLLIILLSAIIEKFKNIREENFVDTQLEEEKKKSEQPYEGIKVLGVLLLIWLIGCVIFGYSYFSDVTMLTDETIIKRSLFNPIGNTYSYSDIISYEFYADEEEPAFRLYTNDNKKIVLSNNVTISSVHSNYEDYEYLCKIDELLKSNGAEKSVKCSKEEFTYYEMDKIYLDRLMSTE